MMRRFALHGGIHRGKIVNSGVFRMAPQVPMDPLCLGLLKNDPESKQGETKDSNSDSSAVKNFVWDPENKLQSLLKLLQHTAANVSPEDAKLYQDKAAAGRLAERLLRLNSGLVQKIHSLRSTRNSETPEKNSKECVWDPSHKLQSLLKLLRHTVRIT